jgi:hypothetical protein
MRFSTILPRTYLVLAHLLVSLKRGLIQILCILGSYACYADSAITSLKDSVEGLKTLDQYAELLIRLLCILPGWNEKNIQVHKLLFFCLCQLGRHVLLATLTFPHLVHLLIRFKCKAESCLYLDL